MKLNDIKVYIVTQQSSITLLPKILEKVYTEDSRILIHVGEERVKDYDDMLWKYKSISFLPHATYKDKYPEQQPIYITPNEENLNNATIIFPSLSTSEEFLSQFESAIYIAEPNDIEALNKKLEDYKKLEIKTQCWQQTPQGGWEVK